MTWFRLILPIFIPSWRFFDKVGTTLHIEVWDRKWKRVRSQSRFNRLVRLFVNPEHNEFLFLISLTERVITDKDSVALKELTRRLDGQKFRILVEDEVVFES